MTNKEQIAEMIDLTKKASTRTYEEAIEALKDYQRDIDRKQARVDARYAEGKGDTELVKTMERNVWKMEYAMEQMQLFVSYLFDANEAEIREDMAK